MGNIVKLVLFVLLFSSAITAQENQKSELTSEQRATLQIKEMTLRLDLDKNQQKEIYKMVKKNTSEREKARAEHLQKRQSGERLTSEERFQFRSSRLDNQIAHKAAMQKILTKEQFNLWEKTKGTEMRNKKGRMGRNYRMNCLNNTKNFGNKRSFRNRR